jgi:phenylacetate-coenzyme A ligase PaaK-like adenylate-forming protein
VHRWLVPMVVFPLAERIAGRRMWTEVRRLRELQWRSVTELEDRALGRLKPLLSHAAEHVPFYGNLFKRAGFDVRKIRTLGDLAAIPISTKADLRADFPHRTVAANLPARRRQIMRTSGSTGLPFEFYWDRGGADALFGAYLFSLEWAGAAIWDTRIVIAVPSYFSTNLGTPSRIRRFARRVILGEASENLSADELTTGRFRALVNQLSRRRRYFIRGYPAATARLAAQLLDEGVPLRSYPRVVIAYSETLTPADAECIRRAFRCPVVNYYSSWEVPQMAQTCPDVADILHVYADRVIVRVVRPDGTAASAGEMGRVVVTDLTNYAMPLINYFVGDHAVVGGPCPCGRGLPTLASVEGRDTEVFRTPGGKVISGGILGHFLTFVAGITPYIWEYQAVLGPRDTLTLRVVPTARFTPDFARRLERELEVFLEAGMAVAVEPVAAIPLESSGKRLIIKPLSPAI